MSLCGKDAVSLSKTLAWGLGLAALLSVGCASRDQDVNAFVHDWEVNAAESDYRVEPPDVIEISSAQAQEIDGELQTVRQDGKISLRLIGDVKIAGMTPSEISRKLETLLSQYYLDPKVNVRLSQAASKHYYVFGQVHQPGAFHLTLAPLSRSSTDVSERLLFTQFII